MGLSFWWNGWMIMNYVGGQGAFGCLALVFAGYPGFCIIRRFGFS